MTDLLEGDYTSFSLCLPLLRDRVWYRILVRQWRKNISTTQTGWARRDDNEEHHIFTSRAPMSISQVFRAVSHSWVNSKAMCLVYIVRYCDDILCPYSKTPLWLRYAITHRITYLTQCPISTFGVKFDVSKLFYTLYSRYCNRLKVIRG